SLPTHPFSQDLREPYESSILQPNVTETHRWVKNRGRQNKWREKERETHTHMH
ncbi:hypothetical protein N340_08115, partial [Tauraco erythrolophus]